MQSNYLCVRVCYCSYCAILGCWREWCSCSGWRLDISGLLGPTTCWCTVSLCRTIIQIWCILLACSWSISFKKISGTIYLCNDFQSFSSGRLLQFPRILELLKHFEPLLTIWLQETYWLSFYSWFLIEFPDFWDLNVLTRFSSSAGCEWRSCLWCFSWCSGSFSQTAWCCSNSNALLKSCQWSCRLGFLWGKG